MRVDTPDTGRMSEVEPQDSDNPDDRSIQTPAELIGGVVLLAIGTLIGVAALPMALEDPSTSCAAGHDCIELVDFRPIGWTGVVVALVMVVLGAWMAYSGSRPSED